MLHAPLTKPRRVLMTLDAVGGIWRYAVDLARSLGEFDVEVLLVGQGPRPSAAQRREIAETANAHLRWLDEPLDWLAHEEGEVRGLGARLSALADAWNIDLLHLNLPSQAADLETDRAVVVVAHSCVVTWWQAVKDVPLEYGLGWHHAHNRAGFDRADIVVTPTAAHAAALVSAYGPIRRLSVVPNGIQHHFPLQPKEPLVLAVGRWWDKGKNGARLDAAAKDAVWPMYMAGPLAGANGDRISLRNANALGELSGSAVQAWMGRASILAAPSLYEPFGLAPLEAARARCALVLADIPTFREVWDDAALFVDRFDTRGFTAALDRLATSPRLRADFSARAHARSLSFTEESQTRLLLDAYAQALSGPTVPFRSVA